MSAGLTYKTQHVTRSQLDRITLIMDALGERHADLYLLTATWENGEDERPASSSDVVLRVGDAVRCTIDPSGRVTENDPRPL